MLGLLVFLSGVRSTLPGVSARFLATFFCRLALAFPSDMEKKKIVGLVRLNFGTQISGPQNAMSTDGPSVSAMLEKYQMRV